VHLSAYEDGTECSETSAYKIQTPGNHPKESIQHSGHDESLKSRIVYVFIFWCFVLRNCVVFWDSYQWLGANLFPPFIHWRWSRPILRNFGNHV